MARIASRKFDTHKLQMMGVPIDGPALLLGDNLSVILSMTVLSATLKKKHQAICYHHIRECIAANVLCFTHINTKTNLADVLTKPFLVNILLRLLQHQSTQEEPCISKKMTSFTKSPVSTAIDLVTLQNISSPIKVAISLSSSKMASDAHSHQAA